MAFHKTQLFRSEILIKFQNWPRNIDCLIVAIFLGLRFFQVRRNIYKSYCIVLKQHNVELWLVKLKCSVKLRLPDWNAWIYRRWENGSNYVINKQHSTQWPSYQIREIVGCACAGNAENTSPSPGLSDPDMHHGTFLWLILIIINPA